MTTSTPMSDRHRRLQIALQRLNGSPARRRAIAQRHDPDPEKARRGHYAYMHLMSEVVKEERRQGMVA